MYYKIVRNINGKLISAVIVGKNQLEYVPGVPTIPKVGKIFVYNVQIHEISAGEEVWLCEVINPVHIKTRLFVDLVDNDDQSFYDFWNNTLYRSRINLVETSQHVCVVDSCTLIERFK